MEARAAWDPQASINRTAHMSEADDDMQDTGAIEARLRAAASLPDLLAATFDAFEAIRQIARDCEDQVPEALLAAFMTAADAAVDGREAVTSAPSLPPHGRADTKIDVSSAASDGAKGVGALARLAVVLRDHLTRASPDAVAPADQAACAGGALAAGRIWQLMAGGDDGACPW